MTASLMDEGRALVGEVMSLWAGAKVLVALERAADFIGVPYRMAFALHYRQAGHFSERRLRELLARRDEIHLAVVRHQIAENREQRRIQDERRAVLQARLAALEGKQCAYSVPSACASAVPSPPEPTGCGWLGCSPSSPRVPDASGTGSTAQRSALRRPTRQAPAGADPFNEDQSADWYGMGL